ncbi:ubiquitin carboxyl-terminal hydrolase 15 isoform X1 [Dendrobium catenatum]|uniref:ubiquitin carboxyl-terminal hydrolase 15 isoform X1 n=1 Tax=Dendrobium catenatum TaxID=906689 RepID=UPI0009F54F8F|nr:ubiquitin carboxyl-terminal hydrolase 15 isoform X1 [Dendrobium catenatum]XP_020681542.1 ubiquitin carboxyl-terminal hydrolase 15 isoform X1 [Dendrobium catenatum]XP_020681543.1 ubiquitin carboxyl-terminal hydrolase 15 isoform X1 [Dendrobium catenatum]XP_020681544.1 ubiquitin carboxyl-terminal hydrolase 15 isoform X1 [Dendrobium catenatum]XP_028554764.1 ubiquitin carboxyl-terminal hydrolase 15 isoform X1 [Dendrobium catenatum]
MLKPREADIPVLFVVLIVLPIVTYILLGKWNEASKKKTKISMLAQIVSEEALRIEAIAPADVLPVVPSLKSSTHVCAKCFALATTRCSRCKSVRYCSGKCQILHWRQGHKQECQQWQTGILNNFTGPVPTADSVHRGSLTAGPREFIGNDTEGHPIFSDFSDEAFYWKADSSLDPQIERKSQDHVKRARGKLKREMLANDGESIFTGTGITCADAQLLGVSSELSTGNFLKDATFKLGPGNFPATDEDHGYDIQGIQIHTSLSSARNSFSEFQNITDENKRLHDPKSPTNLSEKTFDLPQKSTEETIITSRHRYSSGPSEKSKDRIETGKKYISNKVGHEDGSPSSYEMTGLASSAEVKSVKGNDMYKKAPYKLDPLKTSATVPSQCQSQTEKRKSHKETDLRSPQRVPTSASGQSCNGTSNLEEIILEATRNSSKLPKRSFLGLMNSYKKIKVLFPYEDLVKLFQSEVSGISPRGLLNCGNSCYANAVLQCLTFTKPLMVYLLRRSHSRSCRISDWCLICELERHTAMLLEEGGPLSPGNILSNMRSVGCRMGGGKQEDAHEFLRLLVMSMQVVCLEDQGGEKKVDPGLQETTLVQQIFGGRLKSKVKCLRCDQESERYENIMDLTLEIHGWVESLEDALTQFTTPEDLDGENMYRCGRCSAYVRARKQLSLHEVPNILTIVLKRFQTGKYGKISKCVTFPDLLDMIPFVTGSADSPPLYMLYAVVVHLDTQNTSFSGHYVSYVKDIQGTWFRIDDSEVQVVPLSQVMSEGAYMLFYSRCFPRPPSAYIERPLFQAPHLQHDSWKFMISSRHGQHKETVIGHPHSSSVNGDTYLRPEKQRDDCNRNGRYLFQREKASANLVSTDFSDATSSELSLFTSSDDSSFTTESTRDSISTVDHGDSSGLDTISSIFGPFYMPESSHGNGISCTKSLLSTLQTRIHREKRAFILDSSVPPRPFRR